MVSASSNGGCLRATPSRACLPVNPCALVEEMPLQNSFTFASMGSIGFSSPGWTLSEFLGQWVLILKGRAQPSPHAQHRPEFLGVLSWDFLHQMATNDKLPWMG